MVTESAAECGADFVSAVLRAGDDAEGRAEAAEKRATQAESVTRAVQLHSEALSAQLSMLEQVHA